MNSRGGVGQLERGWGVKSMKHRARVPDAAAPLSYAAMLERMYVVVALLVFAGAVLPVMGDPGGVSSVVIGGDAASSAARALIYALFVLHLLVHWRAIARAVWQSKAAWAITLFAAVSVTWSTDHGVTERSSALLGISGLFGVYIGVRFSAREQLEMVAWALAIAVAVSLLFVVATPYGIQPGGYDGAWRGAFIHKNTFGKTMALGVPVFWLAARNFPRQRLVNTGFAVLCVGLVILSRSIGSLMSALFMAMVLAGLPALKSPRVRGWVLAAGSLTIAGVLVTLAVLYGQAFLELLGKDPTLTGRTVLWGMVLTKIAVHPILGYGFDAFWHGHQALYADIWRVVGWNPPHSHNGFLNVTLEVGLVGLGVFVLGLSQTVARSFKMLRAGLVVVSAWPFIYLLYFIVSNLLEVSFLQYSNIFWILYMAAATSVVVASATRRPEVRAA